MIGAIIGDIVGSRFEWDRIKTKEFDFLADNCFVTDDSIMTLAVAKALLEYSAQGEIPAQAAVRCMQGIGRPYPNCGYGLRFGEWMYSDDPQPYNSFGNGSAMRVSAVGWAADSLEEVKALSHAVTGVSHNHPEGLKGAEATAVAIFLARAGKSQAEIKAYLQAHYYDLDFTLDEIRPDYQFNEICQDTVPQALVAFLEATSFEDAIRNAVSLGGDSDTLAAITGGIAEVYFGVPRIWYEEAVEFLNPHLRGIFAEVEEAWPTPILD